MAVTTTNNSTTQQEACPWCEQRIPRTLFLQIQNKMRQQEQERFAAQEVQLRAQLAADRAALETRVKADQAALQFKFDTMREQLEKANEEKAASERRTKELLAEAEADWLKKQQEERKREREILDADYKAKMVKEKADDQEAIKAMQKQVADLELKLAEHALSKPEVVDINLHDELKTTYKDDTIRRVPNADVNDLVVEVKHRGKVCGKILIDARPRTAWRVSYATKLADELKKQDADAAILATLHFPGDNEQLCHHSDDVLIAHPARVVELVGILRQALIRMHRANLSEEKRTEKTQQLYKHITSAAFVRRLADVEQVAKDMDAIDTEEKKEHDRISKRRGLLRTKLVEAHKGIVAGINDIVDGIEK